MTLKFLYSRSSKHRREFEYNHRFRRKSQYASPGLLPLLSTFLELVLKYIYMVPREVDTLHNDNAFLSDVSWATVSIARKVTRSLAELPIERSYYAYS